MNQNEKKLWIKALEGSEKAYRKLGLLYLQTGGSGKDRRLGMLCLKRAMEMGDEKGFLIYHRLFSKGKQVIDDRSYQEMWREYRMAGKGEERKLLKAYLKLGTKKQKRRVGVKGAGAYPSGDATGG